MFVNIEGVLRITHPAGYIRYRLPVSHGSGYSLQIVSTGGDKSRGNQKWKGVGKRDISLVKPNPSLDAGEYDAGEYDDADSPIGRIEV